jgi:hypothetical protein
MKLTAATLAGIVVKRPRPTREAPQGLCLDKGYDYNAVRATSGGIRLHGSLGNLQRIDTVRGMPQR